MMRGIMIVSIGLAGVVASARGDEPKDSDLQRWAIVADRNLQEAGLIDLLGRGLSNRKHLSVVGREQIESLSGRLRVSDYTGNASAKRAWLGKLLQTDMLVLLLRVEDENAEWLRMEISDCVMGARLRVEGFRYLADDSVEMARQCALVIEETRKTFANGIELIASIPEFPVTDEALPWQGHLRGGFANLLNDALSRHRGVAVMRPEEAKAIQKEFARKGNGGGEPRFVEIDFQFKSEKPGAMPRVLFSLQPSGGDGIEKTCKELPPSEMTDFLLCDALKQILRTDTTSVDSEQSYQRLRSRAAMWSQSGQWQTAAGLREAALLLEPDDYETRLAVIGDYRRLADQRQIAFKSGLGPLPASGPPYPARIQNGVTNVLEPFYPIAAHTEHLVRSQSLNPREAGRLVWQSLSDAKQFTYPGTSRVHEFVQELFWKVYPHFPKLNYELAGGELRPLIDRALLQPGRKLPAYEKGRQYQLWTDQAAIQLGFEIPSTGNPYQEDHRHTLDNFYRFLTEVATEPEIVTRMTTMIVYKNSGFCDGIKRNHYTVDQVRQFHNRLEATGQPLNVFYARCGLLALDVYHEHAAPLDKQAVKEVNLLLDFVDRWDRERGGLSTTRSVKYWLQKFREDVVHKAETGALLKTHKLPANPLAKQKHSPEQDPFAFVPDSQRQQHDEAVRAIREFGGTVGAMYGSPRYLGRPGSTPPPRWDTIVFLDKGWRGGDKELEHLHGLHALRVLTIVRADVTDDGLDTIGELAELCSLDLVETEATDAGLVHLGSLPNLRHLRLEGKAGGKEFSSRGLKHLEQAPELTELVLYGPGFTDESLPHVRSMPKFYQLFLIDTAISPQRLAALQDDWKKQRRKFYWAERTW